MWKGNRTPLAYKFSGGLNTVVDPERVQIGTRDNGYDVELSLAVNVSVDERGQASLRNGSIEEQVGEFHSLFCKGGPCFVVQERTSDAAIMQVNPDLSLSGVRSGLTKGKPMAWDQTGENVFYSNGVENGYIRESVSYLWPVHTYQGADADLQFLTAAPVASHIAFQSGGKVLLALGNAVLANHSAHQYGLFERSHGTVVALRSDITMLAAVKGGFFISDGYRTSFFRQLDSWYNYKQEVVEEAPALAHSLAHDPVTLREIGIDSDGEGRIWASTDGVCIGTDAGVFLNLTKSKIKYPSSYTSGACLVKDYTVIHTAT